VISPELERFICLFLLKKNKFPGLDENKNKILFFQQNKQKKQSAPKKWEEKLWED